MTEPNVEENALPKNPDQQLAQNRFLVLTGLDDDVGSAKSAILAKIVEDNMAPFYAEVCTDLGWPLDEELHNKMAEANTAKLETLDNKIADAVKNLGETEIRESMLERAEHLCRIGAKDAALTAFRETYEKTLSLGQRLDIVFNLIRIGLFYKDTDLIERNIDKAKTLIDDGGDWDRRNRLKVYEGSYKLLVRDFKGAAMLLLDTVATFTCYELFSYDQLIVYTVLASLISLSRVELKKRCLNTSEIIETLHRDPILEAFLNKFYSCQYAEFFVALASIEGRLKHDRLLEQHTRYFVREMRIRAYAQLLESYRSLTMASMAQNFGVSIEFIDGELSRFISAGRLNCKIDKVGGIVETNRPDHKNAQYQASIKEGDLLLNRIQKLSRVINI